MSNACLILILSVLQIVCLVVGEENATTVSTGAVSDSSNLATTPVDVPVTASSDASSANATITTTTTTTTTTQSPPVDHQENTPTRRTPSANITSTHPPLVHSNSTGKPATTTEKGNKKGAKGSGVTQVANVLVVAISILTIVPTLIY